MSYSLNTQSCTNRRIHKEVGEAKFRFHPLQIHHRTKRRLGHYLVEQTRQANSGPPSRQDSAALALL